MKLKLPRLANTNSKKQPEKKKRELNNDLLIQIVAELAVIRKIKERSLREQSKPKQAAVVKKPAITIAKKATAVPKAVKPVKQESIKQPTPEIKAPVAGYSAFGSYTGNGSTDGPMVFTGFRPRYIMIKRTDTSGTSWVIFDTARNLFNSSGKALWADLSDAEATYTDFDILSNGFKLRFTSSTGNASGGTYVYAAFAESPFKYSLAR